MIKLYGITNCDKIRAARRWLEACGRAYEFIDFKTIPPQAEWIEAWLKQHDVTQLINRRSTTWRQLTPEMRERILNGDIAAIQAHPTVIKRPLWEINGIIVIGDTQPELLES